MIKIQCFTVGAFQINTYLITDQTSGLSALIDTGETEEVVQHLLALGSELKLDKILLTHGHVDHAGALSYIQQHFNAETYLPRLEKPLFDTLPVQGNWFNAPQMNHPCGRIDHWLDDGDTVQLGESQIRFISTPGHTPGQGCFYTEKEIFVGDTLFAGSIGRTDLPMGDARQMQQSLDKLKQLPEELKVYSGHGPMTSLAIEKRTNPFFNE